MMRTAAACAATVMLAGCIPDLSGFSLVDDAGAEPDAAPSDASTDAATEDAGGVEVDGGEPLPTHVDTHCATHWTKLGPGATSPCAGRQVVTVAQPEFETHDIALGRAIDGTITVAFDEIVDVELSHLASILFHQDSPTEVRAGPAVVPAGSIGERIGVSLALSTQPPDIHHLAYWHRADRGNEVVYRTLRDDVLSEAQTIASGVGPYGVVDVVVDRQQRAVVAWHDDATGETRARRQLAGGAWTMPSTVRTDGNPALVGWGTVALAAGEGAVHLAFQWSINTAASAPSYTLAAATEWAMARTLDNTEAALRTSGVGIDITLIGEEAVIAYLDWVDGIGEVRVARVRGSSQPVVTPRITNVEIADRPGWFPLAIASDALGRVHLVTADASDAAGGITLLQYHREIRVGDETRWIADTIAQIPVAPELVLVDLVVDAQRRPHIVYLDPTGEGDRPAIRYATIRP